MHCVRIAGGIV